MQHLFVLQYNRYNRRGNVNKKELEKNYLAGILGMSIGEWILTLTTVVYLIFPVLRVHLQSVKYDDKRVYVNKGILSKTHEILELYKLQNIEAESNIFGYGKINFIEKNKVITVRYIKNPTSAITEMLDLKDEAQSKRNMSVHEVL